MELPDHEDVVESDIAANHTRTWPAPAVEMMTVEERRLSASKRFRVSLNDSEYEYFVGHEIDAKVWFPVTAYVVRISTRMYSYGHVPRMCTLTMYHYLLLVLRTRTYTSTDSSPRTRTSPYNRTYMLYAYIHYEYISYSTFNRYFLYIFTTSSCLYGKHSPRCTIKRSTICRSFFKIYDF